MKEDGLMNKRALSDKKKIIIGKRKENLTRNLKVK